MVAINKTKAIAKAMYFILLLVCCEPFIFYAFYAA